ncbi:MAG: hypothetical protein M0R80_29370 [Proteobacteria bacterium]|jgi:hypothetical protein|nr:hypothetical protein [Pseudomonadota bacterium]
MKRRLSTLAASAVSAVPAAASANDLGGLAYVVFIWPIGGILLLASIALGVVGLILLRKTSAARRHPAYSIALVAAGLLFGLGYPLLAWGLDSSYDAGGSVDLALVTVIPVEIAAVLLCALGWVLKRKSARMPAGNQPTT